MDINKKPKDELKAKREEIREVIDTYTDDGCLFPDRSCNALGSGYCSSNDESYKCLMERLTKMGCVLKVDKPLPLPPLAVFTTGVIKLTKEDLDKAGYVAVEPLLEDPCDYITRNAYHDENVEPLIEE